MLRKYLLSVIFVTSIFSKNAQASFLDDWSLPTQLAVFSIASVVKNFLIFKRKNQKENLGRDLLYGLVIDGINVIAIKEISSMISGNLAPKSNKCDDFIKKNDQLAIQIQGCKDSLAKCEPMLTESMKQKEEILWEILRDKTELINEKLSHCSYLGCSKKTEKQAAIVFKSLIFRIKKLYPGAPLESDENFSSCTNEPRLDFYDSSIITGIVKKHDFFSKLTPTAISAIYEELNDDIEYKQNIRYYDRLLGIILN